MQLVATAGDPQAKVHQRLETCHHHGHEVVVVLDGLDHDHGHGHGHGHGSLEPPESVYAAADTYVRALTTMVVDGQRRLEEVDKQDDLLVPLYDFIRQFVVVGINDSASGSGSTGGFAIDNKIEQAMDLVKSHLMFAVREEVEVLKEKITELVDRINELEYENGILRAHANSETLALVQTAKSVRMATAVVAAANNLGVPSAGPTNQQQQQPQQQQQHQAMAMVGIDIQQQAVQQPQLMSPSTPMKQQMAPPASHQPQLQQQQQPPSSQLSVGQVAAAAAANAAAAAANAAAGVQ